MIDISFILSNEGELVSFLKGFVTVCAAIFFIFVLISLGAVSSQFSPAEFSEKITKDSILNLTLEGVILDGKTILEPLREYADKDEIKGVLIQINSPGGVVGPSQEIYSEILRIKNELKKPVVVTCNALAASGGYYVAAAASKIITNPGTLMGSIGVIMEFADLSELYSWAKVKSYSIQSGAFKDAGSQKRAMTDKEKEYFQSMIDEVQTQFVSAITDNRKIADYIVDKYADGRIFTGALAVELGFADKLGTYTDAVREIGQLTGLGEKPELFTPPKKRPNLYEMIGEVKLPFTGVQKPISNWMDLIGKPLAILPGVIK